MPAVTADRQRQVIGEHELNPRRPSLTERADGQPEVVSAGKDCPPGAGSLELPESGDELPGPTQTERVVTDHAAGDAGNHLIARGADLPPRREYQVIARLAADRNHQPLRLPQPSGGLTPSATTATPRAGSDWPASRWYRTARWAEAVWRCSRPCQPPGNVPDPPSWRGPSWR